MYLSFQDLLMVIGVFSSLITSLIFYVSFIVKMQKDIEFLKDFYESSKPLLDLVHKLEERINSLIDKIEELKK